MPWIPETTYRKLVATLTGLLHHHSGGAPAPDTAPRTNGKPRAAALPEAKAIAIRAAVSLGVNKATAVRVAESLPQDATTEDTLRTILSANT